MLNKDHNNKIGHNSLSDNTIKNKDLKILNIGRLTHQKDHMTLLRSLKLLKENTIKFKASIIGGGYNYDNLKEYIKTNQLQKEIKLLSYKREKGSVSITIRGALV